MSFQSLSLSEIDRRVTAAQKVVLDFETTTTPPIKDLIKANANAIGTPLEFIFFPLLSVSSHFMGPNTRVMINDQWNEPLILWNVVLAEKGQKKSPALNRFLQPIQKLEAQLTRMAEDIDEADDNDGKQGLPQIYIEHFSMEELHYTLKRNNGRVVGLYDEISLLYEQLDKYKNGSSDRKTLLSLINGSSWRRNFRSSHSIVPKTWFNIAGFVQPDVIVNLLNGNDYDGFCDRQIFVCPPEVDVDYDDIQQPPPTTPPLDAVFQVLDDIHHQSNNNYELSKDAHIEFVAYHDELNERKRTQHRRDRDRKSVLAKAKGQVIRLAAVTFALHQAISKVKANRDDDYPWSFEIPCEFLKKAILLQNFCIEQKFALGKPATTTTLETPDLQQSDESQAMDSLLCRRSLCRSYISPH